MKTKPSVLFLCTGNSARSQMAEALLRHQAGEKFDVFSAGLAPRPVNPLTVTVMDEMGLDIRGQRSKSLKEFMGKTAIDIAIFVCARAEEACPRIYPFALTRLSWPFDDPSAATGTEEAKLSKFRDVRDRIADTIHAWLVKALPGHVRPLPRQMASRPSVIQLYESEVSISNEASPEAGLARFKLLVFLRGLRAREFRTEQFVLERHPAAFEQNPTVAQAIRQPGGRALPLILLDGQVIYAGRYPDYEEFSDLIRLGCNNVPAESSCCQIASMGPETTTTTKQESGI